MEGLCPLELVQGEGLCPTPRGRVRGPGSMHGAPFESRTGARRTRFAVGAPVPIFIVKDGRASPGDRFAEAHGELMSGAGARGAWVGGWRAFRNAVVLAQESCVQEREISLGADDDVVEHLDAEQISGFAEAAREGDVFGARLWPTGGVVVDEDHRGRGVADQGSEDRGGVDGAGDQVAGRQTQRSGGSMLGIERDREEVLDLLACQTRSKGGVHVAARAEAAALR